LTLSQAVALLRSGSRPMAVCELLADKVMEGMLQQDDKAAHCLQLIADTYLHTDCSTVRLSIANCFIYRLGDHIFCASAHAHLLKMLPAPLHDELMRQMMATGL
jgi:hypothetical protein